MHLLLICKARRNQKPKIREAQEQAIRAAKEAKKARQASKKTAMAAAKVIVMVLDFLFKKNRKTYDPNCGNKSFKFLKNFV